MTNTEFTPTKQQARLIYAARRENADGQKQQVALAEFDRMIAAESTSKETTVPLYGARPVDWAKGKFDGHPFEGEVWESHYGLCAGGVFIRYADGTQPGYITDLVITRPTPTLPTLPTVPETVGRATVRGVEDVLIVLADDGYWFSPTRVADYFFHTPEDIDAATFVLIYSPDETEGA